MTSTWFLSQLYEGIIQLHLITSSLLCVLNGLYEWNYCLFLSWGAHTSLAEAGASTSLWNPAESFLFIPAEAVLGLCHFCYKN